MRMSAVEQYAMHMPEDIGDKDGKVNTVSVYHHWFYEDECRRAICDAYDLAWEEERISRQNAT